MQPPGQVARDSHPIRTGEGQGGPSAGTQGDISLHPLPGPRAQWGREDRGSPARPWLPTYPVPRDAHGHTAPAWGAPTIPLPPVPKGALERSKGTPRWAKRRV